MAPRVIEKWWPVLVAVILGIAAMVLLNFYLKQTEVEREQEFLKALGEIEQVVVAARDIPGQVVIEEGMLAYKRVPNKFIQPKALSVKNSAVGKISVARIYKGEQILSSKLTTKLEPETKPVVRKALLPSGKRAFTLSLAETDAAGGNLGPGDHVDIIATFNLPQVVDGKEITQPVTVTLFQDVLIITVGDKAGRGLSAVTLALSSLEVGILSVAQQMGRIQLISRSKTETGIQPVPAVTPQDVLRLYVPTPTPPPSTKIKIIRGEDVEEISVPIKEK
jgi:pilus assembly protein CpaB